MNIKLKLREWKIFNSSNLLTEASDWYMQIILITSYIKLKIIQSRDGVCG